jgi:hypothetical protein
MPAIAETARDVTSLTSPAIDPETGFSLLKPDAGTEKITKLADVKSARIGWTAERRQLLEDLWNRGETAAAIADVLGCKVGAVNVARARFGLIPRRRVSGRPKQEPDEPAHKIERVAFRTSRLTEFCTRRELVAQTGHEAHRWPLVVVKELFDNALDAGEEAGIAPVIAIAITTGKAKQPTQIVVADNGPGIPVPTIAGILDYTVRISSKEAVISPTRGRQGNAIKTLLPMSYVLGGKVKGETWIEAHGVKHQILFMVNQIKQEPLIKQVRRRSAIKIGTRVTVFWPEHDEAIVDVDEIGDLLRQFIWVNPHLTLRFTVNNKVLIDCVASNPNWSKYRASDAPSAHWYSLEQFERHGAAFIARDQDSGSRKKVTVREFTAQFRGMAGTERQRQVLHELGARHLSLARFFGSETEVNHRRMSRLLQAVQTHTRPVRPGLLGVIGEQHLQRLSIDLGGEPASFKYFVSPGQNGNGVPYLIEIATCASKKWVRGKEQPSGRVLITGVNFSATIENPFQTFRGMQGLDEILTELRAGKYAPVIVCVHYVCPHIEYLDRGKSRIGLE